ncbi:MAG: hypothetical protein QOJ00_1272 [Actinomycetota bacterium]|jgi:hypothetical protein
MLAADQRVTVVLHGHGAAGPTELGQQVVDRGTVVESDGVAVGGDGDAQDFGAAAAFAAAFFWAL